MCGIVGFTGTQNAVPFLLKGLKRLEYRGYDSAGISLLEDGTIVTRKRAGRIAALEPKLNGAFGTCGIGHTRWATHGPPTDANAHPHAFGRFSIVHNGIIENAAELKKGLFEPFSSETDSEVVAHLLDHAFSGDLLLAMREVTERLEGSFAIAALCEDIPNCIVAAKRKSPLVVGLGEGASFLASDVLALAGVCETVYRLKDGEISILTPNAVEIYGADGLLVARPPERLVLREESSEKGAFTSFMQKEIAAVPTALEDTLCGLEEDGLPDGFAEALCRAREIVIVACGTAYHAGLAGKIYFERLAGIRTVVETASEFRYGEPLLGKSTLVLAITQSGETADTIAAVRLARERGCFVGVITNVATSSIVHFADAVFVTRAGVEIAVAATKSYNCQLLVLLSLACFAARVNGRECLGDRLCELPELARRTLAVTDVADFAGACGRGKSVFFLGRGLDYALALEGSLKLKEISYLPSEGYPSGEIKHGTLALVEKGSTVVVLMTDERLVRPTLNAVHEVRSRGARVLVITCFANAASEGDSAVILPRSHPLLAPIYAVLPLQLFAYSAAVALGCDPDKPRNLAKSVTVE